MRVEGSFGVGSGLRFQSSGVSVQVSLGVVSELRVDSSGLRLRGGVRVVLAACRDRVYGLGVAAGGVWVDVFFAMRTGKS